MTGEIIGKPDAGAEVLVVIVRDAPAVGAADGLEFLKRARCALRLSSDHVEILVPADPVIEGHAARDFPVILEGQAQRWCAELEVRMARCFGNVGDQTRSRDSPRVCNVGRVYGESDCGSGREFEKSSQDGLMQVIEAGLEVVLAAGKR